MKLFLPGRATLPAEDRVHTREGCKEAEAHVQEAVAHDQKINVVTVGEEDTGHVSVADVLISTADSAVGTLITNRGTYPSMAQQGDRACTHRDAPLDRKGQGPNPSYA